jgi:Mce-associated membrane protein
MAPVTSDASTEPRAEEDAPGGATVVGDPGAADTVATPGGEPAGETRRERRRRERAERRDEAAGDDGTAAGDTGYDARDAAGSGFEAAEPRRRGTFWAPLAVVLALLLVLLLGGVGYLWATRPAASSVSTADYVGVLTQGRQDVVDLTSFDYQTIDQDIAQVRRISVGSLQTDSVGLLQKGRQQFTDQQVVVNTEVVSAAVTQAGGGTGRLVLVIQSTQTTKASTTPKVSRYRIQADLKQVGDRWLLTGITWR